MLRHHSKTSGTHHLPYWRASIIFFGIFLLLVGMVITSCEVTTAIADPFVIDEEESRIIETEVFLGINQIRQENNLSPFQRDSFIDNLAREHCSYMKNTNNCDHNGFEIRAGQIMSQFGASCVGENVAEGYYNASGLIGGWLNSPKHRMNIMDPSFVRIGVGYHGGYACVIFSD